MRIRVALIQDGTIKTLPSSGCYKPSLRNKTEYYLRLPLGQVKPDKQVNITLINP